MLIKDILNEGIKHLEDLPVEKFIENLRNINKFEITEKIDGANLWFGLDEDGKFYTSREAKGGKKFYSENNWGKKFWETGFRSAHKVLEILVEELKNKELILPGDVIEVEILFGKMPNTVTYKGDVNQIVFLRPIKTNDDFKNFSVRFKKMVEYLKGRYVTVTVDSVPYTEDGRTINYRSESHIWKIDITPTVDSSLINREELLKNLEKNLLMIENYLNEPSEISNFKNYEVLAINLNKKPEKIEKEDWKQLKDIIRLKKVEIYNKLQEYKFIIKDFLLKNFLRHLSSKFGPSIEDGGWIEGVVFRDPVTNEQFKLVDKDLFTEINKFNWKIRNLLKRTTETEKIHDLSGRIRKKMAEDMGMPEFYKNVQLTNFIKKNRNLNLDPAKELSKNIDFYDTKRKWISTLKYYKNVLERFLEYYEKNKDKLILTLKTDNLEKKIKYHDEVDRKTKESFAEMFKNIDEYIVDVENSRNSYDLAKIFLKERFEKISESTLLSEGGNVFQNTGIIYREEVFPTLEEFSKISGIDYNDLSNNLLGSTGKKIFSNDIDIAVSSENYEKEKIFNYIRKNLGSENVRLIGNAIHVKFPIKFTKEMPETRKKYVQIDLFFGDDKWLKFFYHSPGEESKLKGIHRNILINSILKNVNVKKSEEKDTYGRPVETIKYKFTPKKGFLKVLIKSLKDKKGQYLKKQQEENLSVPLKDIDLVAKTIFGRSANKNIFNSVESLVDGIKKYLPEVSEAIFKDFAETIKTLPEYYENYEFPEEIRKYF